MNKARASVKDHFTGNILQEWRPAEALITSLLLALLSYHRQRQIGSSGTQKSEGLERIRGVGI